MRYYKVKGRRHTVYDSSDEAPSDIKTGTDWRLSGIGDWVLSDDDCIIQILRKGSMLRSKGKERKREWVGTCTGTFMCQPNVKMDTSRRKNIYSFGGEKYIDERILSRRKLTKSETLFVQYLVSGFSPRDSYLKAFPTSNERYAMLRSGQLTKTERIQTEMKKELKPLLTKLGIDEEYVLNGIKDTANMAEKEDVRLRALFKLSDILDLEDKSVAKVTQLTGAVFQGFSDDEIKGVERPVEIES
ncbi:hypothetical protein CL614_06560 [archaeon]|nr:hypothetical protein [archaeon]